MGAAASIPTASLAAASVTGSTALGTPPLPTSSAKASALSVHHLRRFHRFVLKRCVRSMTPRRSRRAEEVLHCEHAPKRELPLPLGVRVVHPRRASKDVLVAAKPEAQPRDDDCFVQADGGGLERAEV